MNSKNLSLTALLACAVLAAPASGADLQKRFSLLKAVPADCWFYAHTARNPEREFLRQHWSHVWKAIKSAHLDQDFKRMLMSDLQDEQARAEFEGHWSKAVELAQRVQWSDLTEHEAVWFSSSLVPVPDVTVLFKPEPETAKANFDGLKAILEELAQLGDEAELVKQDAKGAVIWSLKIGDAPMALRLFQRRDIMGLSLSPPEMLESVIGLISSGDDQACLAESKRFKQALASVPPAEDGISFLDMKRIMGQLRQLAAQGAPARGEGAQGDAPAGGQSAKAAMLKNMLDQIDFVDYIISTAETRGLQTYEHDVVRLTEAGKDKPLCRILSNPKPLDEYYGYVPKEALGFRASSGIDPTAAYDFMVKFMVENFPQGQEWLSTWATVQQNMEFDVRQELLSWLDGQSISVVLKPSVKTMFASPDSVILLKVKDEGRAVAVLDKLVNRLGSAAGQNQPMLTVTQAADVHAPGFRSLIYPPMAMMGMGKFTFGVNDGWLIVSTSAPAINKCLAARAGLAPTFQENSRFQKEGLAHSKPVVSASFSDTRNMAQELSTMLFMVQMMAAAVPPGPEYKIPRAMMGMAGKLSPAASKMTFIRSTASTSQFDGDAWLTETVTSYKDYVPPSETPAATAGAEEEPDKAKKKTDLDGL